MCGFDEESNRSALTGSPQQAQALGGQVFKQGKFGDGLLNSELRRVNCRFPISELSSLSPNFPHADGATVRPGRN
jgi:hypothetical protein